MQINCCKDCTERSIGCHSICIDYIIEKEKNDKLNEEKLKYMSTNKWTDRYIHSKIEMLNRKKKGFKY